MSDYMTTSEHVLLRGMESPKIALVRIVNASDPLPLAVDYDLVFRVLGYEGQSAVAREMLDTIKSRLIDDEEVIKHASSNFRHIQVLRDFCKETGLAYTFSRKHTTRFVFFTVRDSIKRKVYNLSDDLHMQINRLKMSQIEPERIYVSNEYFYEFRSMIQFSDISISRALNDPNLVDADRSFEIYGMPVMVVISHKKYLKVEGSRESKALSLSLADQDKASARESSPVPNPPPDKKFWFQ